MNGIHIDVYRSRHGNSLLEPCITATCSTEKTKLHKYSLQMTECNKSVQRIQYSSILFVSAMEN